MKSDFLKDLLLGIACIVIQIVIFRHLKIYGIQPDIVLLYVIWLMTRRDRTSVIIIAAILGFGQDALLNLWGLNMFAKTLVAFAGYNFMPKQAESRLLTSQVFILLFIIALFHNIIFIGLASFIKSYATGLFFWYFLIGGSLYTAIVGSIVYLFKTQ
ncbi:MAG TPA: rod shape-determining protein MreD [Balneolales bacterium]|nr:rod shape-determining protein MreD [Balneolales bacterium]